MPVRDDLRLAASELFSGAVEAGDRGPRHVRTLDDEGGVELRAEDVELEERDRDPEGWTGRFALDPGAVPGRGRVRHRVRIRVPHPAETAGVVITLPEAASRGG